MQDHRQKKCKEIRKMNRQLIDKRGKICYTMLVGRGKYNQPADNFLRKEAV